MRMQYRDNMTPEELVAFKAELAAEDAMHEVIAADIAASVARDAGADPEELDAAYEQSYDHLNRIAGDRR